MSGRIAHFEINGPDEHALGGFYSQIFGWQVQYSPDFQYGVVTTGDGQPGGGIGRAEEHSAPILYIEVDRLEHALAAINAKGGATITEPTVVPGIVRFATFRDPAGNVLGLVEAEVPPAT